MRKFITAIKRLLKPTDETSGSNHATTSFIESPTCSSDEMDRLLTDGYVAVFYSRSIGEITNLENDVPQEFRDSRLPVMVEWKFNVPINQNNLLKKHRMLEVSTELLFATFNEQLKIFVQAQIGSDRALLNRTLITVEEIHVRQTVKTFFEECFYSFEYDEILMSNYNKHLPVNTIHSNLLSKVWLFENYKLKPNIFREEFALLYNIVYHKQQINFETIHLTNNAVGQWLLFEARKQLMIQLNETYNFEQSHPYTLNRLQGIHFEDHSDLFLNEQIFEWAIRHIRNFIIKDKVILFSELCKALDDEKVLRGIKSQARFKDFINQKFHMNLVKFRLTEISNIEGADRVNSLKIELKKLK